MAETDLKIKIIVDGREGTVAFDQVNDSVKKTGKSVGFLSSELATLGAGIVAGFSINAITNFTVATLQSADVIGKLADRTGFTTDAIQKLGFAGEQTGVRSEQMNAALERFNRRLGLARQGSTEYLKVYEQLNVSLKDSVGNYRNVNAIFGDVVNAVGRLSSEADQSAAITRLFGEEARALVNTFKGGTDALAQYASQLENVGGVMDEQLIRNAEAANDALNLTTKAVKGLSQSLILNLAPSIQEGANELEQMIQNTRREINTIKQFFSDFRTGVDLVIDSWAELGKSEIKPFGTEGLRLLPRLAELLKTTSVYTKQLTDNLSDVGIGSRQTKDAIDEMNRELEEQAQKAQEAAEVDKMLLSDLEKIGIGAKQTAKAIDEMNRELEKQQDSARKASEINKQLARDIAKVGKEGKDLEKIRLDEDIERRRKAFAETGDIKGREQFEENIGEYRKKKLAEIEQRFEESTEKQVEYSKNATEEMKSSYESWADETKENIRSVGEETNRVVSDSRQKLATVNLGERVGAYIGSRANEIRFKRGLREQPEVAGGVEGLLQANARRKLEATNELLSGYGFQLTEEEQTRAEKLAKQFRFEAGQGEGASVSWRNRRQGGALPSSSQRMVNVNNVFNVAATDAASFLDQQTIEQLQNQLFGVADKIGMVT